MKKRNAKELPIMRSAHEVVIGTDGNPPHEMVGFLLHELLCEDCGGPHAGVSYLFSGLWNGESITLHVYAALHSDDAIEPAQPGVFN